MNLIWLAQKLVINYYYVATIACKTNVTDIDKTIKTYRNISGSMHINNLPCSEPHAKCNWYCAAWSPPPLDHWDWAKRCSCSEEVHGCTHDYIGTRGTEARRLWRLTIQVHVYVPLLPLQTHSPRSTNILHAPFATQENWVQQHIEK